MSDINDLIAGAPSAGAADLVGDLGTAEPVADAVAVVDHDAPRVRQYIPTTGTQISKFIRAVQAGMKDAHYASEGEVEAFVAALPQ